MASYIFMIFNLITRFFSPSTISSSIEDASEDYRVYVELYRRRASDRIIEKHYAAMMAKRDRNPLYRISMETEMEKAGREVRVAATLLERKVFLSWHMLGISQSQNSSSGGAGRADAGVVPSTAGVVPGTADARNSRIAASSSHVSIRVESDEAVNVEPAGGSQPSSPESQAIDDPVLSGGIDLEFQRYSNHHVEDSSAEYRVTLLHRILFGNEANIGIAFRNVIQLSGASSDGVVPPLVWIGFLASVFAPLVRRKWSRVAKDFSLIGHISTAWWHLVLLSTKYRSEQYSFVNTTLTALFCIVIALALIRAGR